MKELILELQKEIEVLQSSEYRAQQEVRLENNQLKLLKRLRNQIYPGCDPERVKDFCRIVDDYCPPTSRISNLCNRLYELSRDKEI